MCTLLIIPGVVAVLSVPYGDHPWYNPGIAAATLSKDLHSVMMYGCFIDELSIAFLILLISFVSRIFSSLRLLCCFCYHSLGFCNFHPIHHLARTFLYFLAGYLHLYLQHSCLLNFQILVNLHLPWIFFLISPTILSYNSKDSTFVFYLHPGLIRQSFISW